MAFKELTPVSSYAMAAIKLTISPTLPISLNIPMESRLTDTKNWKVVVIKVVVSKAIAG